MEGVLPPNPYAAIPAGHPGPAGPGAEAVAPPPAIPAPEAPAVGSVVPPTAPSVPEDAKSALAPGELQ